MPWVFVPRSSVNMPTVGDNNTDTITESNWAAAVSLMEQQDKSVYIDSAVEDIAWEFLLDTESESCVIVRKELKRMSKKCAHSFSRSVRYLNDGK